MNILVTGGDGVLGTLLVERLKKDGHSVRIFTGDVRDDKNVEKNFNPKPEIVYHLAAVLDESDPGLWGVNVNGTKKVIESCKNANVVRFILMSSAGVLGETKKASTETDAYAPDTLYEKSKMQQELMTKQSGIPFTIIRSTIIIAPNNFWKQIFRAAKKHYPIIGTGNNFFHLIYVADAVEALVLALKPEAENQTYNIAGPEAKTYEQTYETICRVVNVPMTKKHVSVGLAKTFAGLHEFSSKIRGRRPKVTKMRTSINRLVRNRLISFEKARSELGFSPKWGLEEAFKEIEKSFAREE